MIIRFWAMIRIKQYNSNMIQCPPLHIPYRIRVLLTLKSSGLHCTFKSNCHILILSTDDLSFNAVASQSRIFPGPSHMYEANNALDRNTATCMRTDQTGDNSVQKTTWWKVDLGGNYTIYSISILFKNYDNLGM